MTVGSISQGGNATFNFTGGTLQANGPLSTSVLIVLQTAGSNGTFNTNGYTSICSGPISGPGGLIVAGSGSLVLTASNNYSGTTTLGSGTLVAANSVGSATGTGNVILSGGVLTSTASGTISGAVVAGAGPHSIVPGGAFAAGQFGTLSLGSLTTNATPRSSLCLGQPGRQRCVLGKHDQYPLGRLADSGRGRHRLTSADTPVIPGNYRLFSGSFGSPALGNFSLTASFPNVVYAFSTDRRSGIPRSRRV